MERVSNVWSQNVSENTCRTHMFVQSQKGVSVVGALKQHSEWVAQLQKCRKRTVCGRKDFDEYYETSTYNLTVYEMDSKDVECYMRHEGEGGRESSDISTCV